MNLHELKTGQELSLECDLPHSKDSIRIINDTIGNREGTVNVPTGLLNLNGVAIQDSFEKYLDNEYLSSGMFKEAMKTPLHYLFAKNDKSELEKIQKKGNCFELGTFIHQCILEPTKFKRAIVEPSYSLASLDGVNIGINFWERLITENSNDSEILFEGLKQKAIGLSGSLEKIQGKKTYLKLLIENSDFETVTEENYFKIQIIKRNIDKYSNGIIYKIFKHSKREISFYAEFNGLKQRVRPDAIQFKENIGLDAILSVKSTSCEDLKAFYYQCAKMSYDLSESMYQQVVSYVTGREFHTTITLMLQTVAPFGVALLIWDKDDISVGSYKYNMAVQTVLETESTRNPMGYDVYADPEDNGIIQMKLPDWNNRELLPSAFLATHDHELNATLIESL